jgi:hypothetical protein
MARIGVAAGKQRGELPGTTLMPSPLETPHVLSNTSGGVRPTYAFASGSLQAALIRPQAALADGSKLRRVPRAATGRVCGGRAVSADPLPRATTGLAISFTCRHAFPLTRACMHMVRGAAVETYAIANQRADSARRSCIREKQRRGWDCSYPCDSALARRVDVSSGALLPSPAGRSAASRLVTSPRGGKDVVRVDLGHELRRVAARNYLTSVRHTALRSTDVCASSASPLPKLAHQTQFPVDERPGGRLAC